MRSPKRCGMCGVELAADNTTTRCAYHQPTAIALRAKEAQERAVQFAAIRKKHGV